MNTMNFAPPTTRHMNGVNPTANGPRATAQAVHTVKHHDDRRMALAWALQAVLAEHPEAIVRSRGDFDVLLEIEDEVEHGLLRVIAWILALPTAGLSLLALLNGGPMRDQPVRVHLMIDEYGNLNRFEHDVESREDRRRRRGRRSRR